MLARYRHIIAPRHYHQVGLPQSFDGSSPIGMLITSVEVMRIQGIVFVKWVDGEVIDMGATSPLLERRGGSEGLPHGLIGRVGWRMREGMLRFQCRRRVQVVDGGGEEGIVSGGWRVRSATT